MSEYKIVVPTSPLDEQRAKWVETQDKKIERLIRRARAGNGELLAQYLENPRCYINETLLTFLADLVRKTKPPYRPESYAAFRRNRRIAWFVATCLLSADRPGGRMTEKAIKQVREGGKLKLSEKVIEEACESRRFGKLDRTTVQRAWKNHPDLHDPLTVEGLLALGPDAWRREHLV